MTLSLNTSFTGQVSTGTLRASGRVRAGGRSIFFSSTEVSDGEGRVIAHGEAVNRYRRGSEDADHHFPLNTGLRFSMNARRPSA